MATSSATHTKLQELAVSRNGLIVNIVSFNVGVEIGQALALTAVLIAISYWRRQRVFSGIPSRQTPC